MGETSEHYIKWNNPDLQSQGPYVFSHVWKLDRKSGDKKERETGGIEGDGGKKEGRE